MERKIKPIFITVLKENNSEQKKNNIHNTKIENEKLQSNKKLQIHKQIKIFHF